MATARVGRTLGLGTRGHAQAKRSSRFTRFVATQAGTSKEIITEGTGPTPNPGDEVTMHYTVGTELDQRAVARPDSLTCAILIRLPGHADGRHEI